ncbi:MAG: hypothetical protein KJI72_01640 [Patescibacteria group bacterium]|nr:hypothetical protein [Patescibacteria group bacterium]
MRKNKSTIIWVIVVVFVLGGLFALPKFFGSSSSPSGSGIPCLAQHLPVREHIHPQLTITVDSEFEAIPGTIGNSPCLRTIHTHDRTGELHIEPQDDSRYTLVDFFRAWGQSIEREGYVLEITVDGTRVENPATIIFKDRQRIVMEYTVLEN